MISLFPVIRVIALISTLFFGFYTLSYAAVWPRQITDSKGTHTIEHPPERIVSTSVTLTGSLLAIDAPVIASGATTPGNNVADAQGFFRQWGEIAKQRHVQRLYIGEANAEAVAAQRPDLILLSATGGDSALALYSQLSAIAPTLVINYDDKSWQQLLTLLGDITGHEQQATARITDFNARLEKVRARITLPEQPISALVYTSAAHSANLWTTESAQGQLLKQLGFTLATLPSGLHSSQSQGKRRDITQAGGENLSVALNGNSFLLFANNDKDAQALMADPLLAHLPAIQQRRVWALGNETFRLDYYSATLVLDRLNTLFGKP